MLEIEISNMKVSCSLIWELHAFNKGSRNFGKVAPRARSRESEHATVRGK